VLFICGFKLTNLNFFHRDDDYSDADDVSWKVRRASAKLLASIINTRSERITDLFRRTASNLIARFKEREESVRVEILNTFVALVRQIGVTTGVLTSSQHSQSNQENWRSASNSALDSEYVLLSMFCEILNSTLYK
jgi:predicted glycosyl hydrolase (DUF1957 family)